VTNVLAGAVVVVTGAAHGIGAACADALEDRGATAVAVDIDDVVAEREYGVVADLRDERACIDVMARVVAEHGRLDALVNNVGVGRHNPITDIRTDDIDLMWQLNVRSTIVLTRQAFRVMREQERGGQVVNVVSTAGLRGEPGESAYCATKFAVRGFTEAAAEEGRLYGIRVHGVYPAGVDTGFWRDATVGGPGVDPSAVFLRPRDVGMAIVRVLESPAYTHTPEIVVRALADADTARIAAKLERFRS